MRFVMSAAVRMPFSVATCRTHKQTQHCSRNCGGNSCRYTKEPIECISNLVIILSVSCDGDSAMMTVQYGPCACPSWLQTRL